MADKNIEEIEARIARLEAAVQALDVRCQCGYCERARTVKPTQEN